MYGGRSTLDCQDCGIDLRELTPGEVQEVADRPYDFVIRCGPCSRHRHQLGRTVEV